MRLTTLRYVSIETLPEKKQAVVANASLAFAIQKWFCDIASTALPS